MTTALQSWWTKARASVRTALAPRPIANPLNGGRGWFPLVKESYTGAWQQNVELRADSVANNGTVYSCVTLIANDIAKLGLHLVERIDLPRQRGVVWQPVEVPAFSPVLRKPNRYQTRITFVAQWMCSKLLHGNTYVLKQRDARGVVVALYVLDPLRVTPLVSPDGAVYYELRRDDLSGLPTDQPVVVPAREIIHDLMNPLFHPLVGLSPIYACGLAALQGKNIQSNSEKFFGNSSQPGGILTAPGKISEETAVRLKETFETSFSGDNFGKLLVVSDGLTFEKMTINAVDAQLIEQLQWTAKNICACYHVPAHMVEAGPPPNFNNIDALLSQYFSQCLQAHIESFELCLNEGLGLPATDYGTKFNIDDLIRLDTPTRTKAAADGVNSGCLTPNEARHRYFELGPVPGGDSPYLQQQYWPLETLAKRDTIEPDDVPDVPPPEDDDAFEEAALVGLVTKQLSALQVA